MDRIYACYASSAFGMEGLVARELRGLGLSDVAADNGGVRFSADGIQIFKCNLMMHFSDRIFVILASAECTSFENLFVLVHSICWRDFFGGSESIDISCKCTRSKLMSPRDCQSITKKAIIEKIRESTGQIIFPESGPSLSVHVSIRNDRAMILLNTSGAALSRRGYRTWNGEAPLRETLAAALVELSGWHPGQPLHDPCCGTGTILTEAAIMASGRAPCLLRSFQMEDCTAFCGISFTELRSRMEQKTDWSRAANISGSDVDHEALMLARRHIIQAGMAENQIRLEQIPLQKLSLSADHGVFICNPPYGERLGDHNECRRLYHDLHELQKRHPSWRMCAISSDPAFERSYGQRASRKRRLYNGRLECVFYQFD